MLSSSLWCGCTAGKKDPMALPYYNEPTFTPLFLEGEAEIDRQVNHRIADFSFLNQDSVRVDQTLIENRIHVANFIFTSCGSICPTMTRNLKMVADGLKESDDVLYVSYSVTPWIDTPHRLKKFKSDYGITTANWHFLTGPKAEIYNLARQSYFAEEDIGFSKDSTEFLHTEHFVLVDKARRIRGIYNGTLPLEMEQLMRDIHTLKEDEK